MICRVTRPIEAVLGGHGSVETARLREEMAKNPLTVLPAGGSRGPLVAESAELVGNYAIKIKFSDGHDTGIYSWAYLREIDPDAPKASDGSGGPGER